MWTLDERHAVLLGGAARLRGQDRLSCVVSEPLRSPAAYAGPGAAALTDSPASPSGRLPPRGATSAGGEWRYSRAAYPGAHTLQGCRRGHGPNIRALGLLTAGGPRFGARSR